MRIGKFVRSRAATIGAVAVMFSPGSLHADDADEGVKVTPLMQRPFPDLPGKEGLVLLVEFGPGHADVPHRHNAHVFVYVLEGSVKMQVKGGKSVVLKPGDMFYENPQDVHPVGVNLSKTKPAKLLVFFVKSENAPPVLPPTDN